jgi:enterochelin esterase-like enzyme
MRGLNELTVVSPQFIGVLFVLAAVGWWRLLRRPAEPRRPLRSWLIGGLAGVLSLSAVASCVNSYFSYLPKVRDVFDVVAADRPPDVAKAAQTVPSTSHSHGEMVRLRVPDNGSGFGVTSALVWLPPQYFSEPDARFPVVYLFHGSPGVPKDWFRGGEADRIALSLARAGKPAILVAPRMSKGWLDDPECVDGVREKVETHVLRDVIPSADSSLRTVATREGRIFAGMSAGGYCALNLGLRNRAVAATVLNLSGLTEPTHAKGLRSLFGQTGSTLVAQNTPAFYAVNLPSSPRSRLWLDCGSSDHQVLRQMQAIAPVLRSRGLTVEEKVRPGEHTFGVWRAALRDGLNWALSGLPTSTRFVSAAD